jgi:hypothetical protein
MKPAAPVTKSVVMGQDGTRPGLSTDLGCAVVSAQ